MSKLSSISSSEAVLDLVAEVASDRPRRRAACARRGRRIVGWLLAGIALTWAAGNLLIDLCPMKFRFPEGAYVIGHVPTGADSPLAITFGNSRFRCGLYADELGAISSGELGWSKPVPIYSGAVPAGTSITFDLLLAQMLDRGARPRLLIVEISPETVGQYAPWLNFDTMRHLDFFQAWAALPDGYRSRAQARILSSRLVPVYRHNLHLRQWALDALGIDPVDEIAPFMAYPNHIQTPQGPITDQPMRRWFRHYRVGGIQVSSMERLLSRCRAHGIKVLLVGTPVSSPHRAHYTPAVRREYHRYIETLGERFDVSFMDFADRIPDAQFADHHHLLESGGHAFTRMVATEFLAPQLRRLLDPSLQATR